MCRGNRIIIALEALGTVIECMMLRDGSLGYFLIFHKSLISSGVLLATMLPTPKLLAIMMWCIH